MRRDHSFKPKVGWGPRRKALLRDFRGLESHSSRPDVQKNKRVLTRRDKAFTKARVTKPLNRVGIKLESSKCKGGGAWIRERLTLQPPGSTKKHSAQRESAPERSLASVLLEDIWVLLLITK